MRLIPCSCLVAALLLTGWQTSLYAKHKEALAPAAGGAPVPAAGNKAEEPRTLRHLAAGLPLPITQKIDRQNSESDKLLIEVTDSKQDSQQYVAYIKILWGDLDNVIKGDSKAYYSNWTGNVTIANGTGTVEHKIAFDDKTRTHKLIKLHHVKNGAPTTAPATQSAGPGPGSGRDALLVPAGKEISWEAGVVGGLDGLKIRITSDQPVINLTVKAGNFTVPVTINAGTAATTTADPETPAGHKHKLQ